MKNLKNRSLIRLMPLFIAVAAAVMAGCQARIPLNPTPAGSATVTPVNTVVQTAVNTATRTLTGTPTQVIDTATVTNTKTPTEVLTATETATATQTATNIASAMPTVIGGIAQPTVVLGTSSRFAILSHSSITDVPTSLITGNVGLYPGTSSSCDLDPITEINGTGINGMGVAGAYEIYVAGFSTPVDDMLIQAKADALAGYNDAVNAVRGTATSLSGNINGLTLAPGLYESLSTIEISPAGILYLDGQGDPDAVFVIRSSTSITTEAGSEVVLTGSAQAKNVFWSAGTAVTLGTNSKMKGTFIASSSVSLLTGARLDGRVLIQGAAAGSVALQMATIVLP